MSHTIEQQWKEPVGKGMWLPDEPLSITYEYGQRYVPIRPIRVVAESFNANTRNDKAISERLITLSHKAWRDYHFFHNLMPFRKWILYSRWCISHWCNSAIRQNKRPRNLWLILEKWFPIPSRLLNFPQYCMRLR